MDAHCDKLSPFRTRDRESDRTRPTHLAASSERCVRPTESGFGSLLKGSSSVLGTFRGVHEPGFDQFSSFLVFSLCFFCFFYFLFSFSSFFFLSNNVREFQILFEICKNVRFSKNLCQNFKKCSCFFKFFINSKLCAYSKNISIVQKVFPFKKKSRLQKMFTSSRNVRNFKKMCSISKNIPFSNLQINKKIVQNFKKNVQHFKKNIHVFQICT